MSERRRWPRFFWRYDDGEYVYTGMYLWRGYFGGIVRLAGRRAPLFVEDTP